MLTFLIHRDFRHCEKTHLPWRYYRSAKSSKLKRLVLYGKNVWRITVHAPIIYTPLSDGPKGKNLWQRRGKLIKHILFVFDQRDIDAADYVLSTRFLHQIKAPHNRKHNNLIMHAQADDSMWESWRLKVRYSKDMPHLRSVELDVSGLFCYFGCCRSIVLEHLLQMLSHTHILGTLAEPGQPALSKSDSKILISGIRGSEESGIVRNAASPLIILEEES